MTKPGPLLILSGPSGSGKSTVISRLLATTDLPLHVAVSATTRSPRQGEVDGVSYHFWSPERFEAERQAGAFLECANVHGRWYGTLRREVDPYREKGIGVILVIDVQGARTVRQQYPGCLTVFLQTGSMETYECRLRQRGTESEAAIRGRLETARTELACASTYDYQVVNDDLDQAVAELRAILQRGFQGDGYAG
ncbi:MAG TPA: guanylate kinase [Gemmataceae bacterium]|nr:guanylate kinase [Gemmataceae bacterium]